MADVKQTYTPLSKEELKAIKPGDIVERMLAFCIPMYLVVQETSTEEIIDCGWTFERNTGLELDEEISVRVSYIRRVLTEEQKAYLAAGNKEVPFP